MSYLTRISPKRLFYSGCVYIRAPEAHRADCQRIIKSTPSSARGLILVILQAIYQKLPKAQVLDPIVIISYDKWRH